MADIQEEIEPLGYSSENLREQIISNLKQGNLMGSHITEEQVDKFVNELPELSEHISTLFDRIVDLVTEYPDEILHAAGVTITAGFGYYAMNPELVGALFIGTRSCHMNTLACLAEQIEQKEKATAEADISTALLIEPPSEKEVAYVSTEETSTEETSTEETPTEEIPTKE